jgi:hypothetical protein
MRNKIWLVTGLIGMLGAAAFAQRAVSPPPKPADSGPSLATTLQFIQEKVSDMGKVNYILNVQDTTTGSNSTSNIAFELSNVTTDASTCHVGFHWRFFVSSARAREWDDGFSLREVENVVVEPLEQYQTAALRTVAFADVINVTVEPWEQYFNRVAGTSNQIQTTTQPPTLYLSLVRSNEKIHPGFFFQDANLADRVAKAMVHAVELCGGGNKEPF